MTKLTKKDLFKMVAGVIDNSNVENKEDLQKFIAHEIELLEKKALAKSSTETAKQKENNGFMEDIYNILVENEKAMTITEIQQQNEQLAELTNQRMSALLKKLVDAGRVVRAEFKKKAYFKIAE